jgi:hypothetical protein
MVRFRHRESLVSTIGRSKWRWRISEGAPDLPVGDIARHPARMANISRSRRPER